MKRRIVILTILVAIAALIWWEERPRPQTLVLTGTVDGNEVVVGSKITGRIDSLAVDDGQRVKAGDLIAVLDQDELRADQGAAGHAIAQARYNAQQSAAQTELLESTLPTKVQQAAAQVEQTQAQLQQNQAQAAQAQAQLQQAQAQVEQTKASVAKTQDNFNRIRPLVEKDINPPQDLVSARTDLDSAKANQQAAEAAVEAARKAVASAEAGAAATQRAVAAARAELADAQNEERQITVQERQTDAMRAAAAQAEANAAAANARFDQTRIYAPASGIVTLRAARQGEVVNPGNPIVTLFDLSSTWVDADVEETYADLIKMGQNLTVRLPSGAEIAGPVIYKAVEADFATQRDVSRTKRDIKTVAIRIKVPNPDGQLPLGMTAWVILPVPALPPHPVASAAKD
ncbi:MAG TPA: efflux RND transporter periplasmic adaptor subunit [Acetobacteraceae bacterium]|nr:efflux RND transporter periplasmic adaptor subunit [Acetobacteraceae bacterium]